MSKWRISTIASLVLLSIVEISECQVTLKVLLQPPMITLECLIINPTVKATVVMMCPNNVMCFHNCSRMCGKDCADNNITCTARNLGIGISFAYRFDTSNVRNQGEWRCHFGEQESSTVILFNDTKPDIPIPKNELTSLPKTTSASTVLQTYNVVTENSAGKKIKGLPIIKEENVIGLLTIFAISLCINVILITRFIIFRIYFRTNPSSHNKESCFLKLCVKTCCIDRPCGKGKYHRNNSFHEHMLARQVSNIYESAVPSLIQPAILLDNYAFIGTPNNQRMLTPSAYARSLSFPSKFVESRPNELIMPNKVYTTPIIRPTYPPHIPSQESVNQIIYDDVPEQSISYVPQNYIGHMNTFRRPSQYINMNGSLTGRAQFTAMSMNNLATTAFRMSESAIYGDENNDESVLKDAINSRVELSKEMINQADCLLRRADTLLGDKDTQISTTST